MSRILKRPMFRKGGEVMEGIMTGIKPRTNYSDGSLDKRVENYKNVLRAAQGASGGPDGLSQFLIRGGMNLVSGANEGDNVLQTLAGAYQKPTEQLFASLDKKAQQEKQIGLQGAMLGIKGEQGMEIARAKAKNQFLQDLPPQRKKFELIKEFTKESKGFKKDINKLKPEAMADFYAIQAPRLRELKNFQGKNIQVYPHKISGSNIEFKFDDLIPGTIYFRPDQANVMFERDPENQVIIQYNISTGEKIKEIKIGG
jgi:hypothetical protein